MNTPATEMTHSSSRSHVPDTPYERLGGEAGVLQLVRRFYALVDGLPEAYAVPSTHLQGLQAREDNLLRFLSDWFGGPALRPGEKVYPRLHLRRSPYAIGAAQRDAWMQCMDQALSEQVADAALRTKLIDSFAQIADQMAHLPIH